MTCFANFKFGGILFSKIMPNFCRHRATARQNIAIHYIVKIKLTM